LTRPISRDPVSRFSSRGPPARHHQGFSGMRAPLRVADRYTRLSVCKRFCLLHRRTGARGGNSGALQSRRRRVLQKDLREDLERWDRDVKPASIRTHKELLSVDPQALSDDELIAYIEQCRDNLERMIYQHHSFNLAAILPVGDFMAHVGAWTDAPIGEFLALTRGRHRNPPGPSQKWIDWPRRYATARMPVKP